MRLYLTGSSGFVGQCLAGRVAGAEGEWGRISLGFDPDLDILDGDALAHALDRFAPDAILHLAAQSNVPASIADPVHTARVNVMGTLNLLDAMERAAPRARLLHVGSGDIYGLVPEQSQPITEQTPLAPRNPYAASKVAAEMFVLERTRRGRVKACCVRAFNHTGPGQSADFVFPALALQIARLARSGQGNGEVIAGDLDITRDFLDVRDVIDAYGILLEKGEVGAVYNVCSGEEVSLRKAAEQMAVLAGVTPCWMRDPRLTRPAEQRRVCGSPERLRALGWARSIPFEKTLRDILADCLSRAELESP